MKSIDVFCVFPESVRASCVGVVGRAIERGIVELNTFDLREFTSDGRIDDMPFGGGAGMVVRVDVISHALEEVYDVPATEVKEQRRVVLTESWGHTITQEYIEEIAADEELTIICGRYGGVDERVRERIATETVSLGNFVLSGGEIVAAALVDALVRRVEGVLGNAESLVGESFSEEGVIGAPQYTRPAEWDGVPVPGVLLSGNHAEIRAWREGEARKRAQFRAAGQTF